MPSNPTVLILRGDDEFAMHAFTSKLLASLGDPSLVDMNTTRLDGRTANEDALHMATGAVPFLAERRLTILSYPLARLANKEAQIRFISLLDGLPETSLLVMIVNDVPKNRKIGDQWEVVWEVLHARHWLVQWCQKTMGRCEIKDFRLPSAYDMPNWIMKRAQDMGGELRPAAAKSLAEHTGSDTRLAEMEIEKLLNYVNYEHAVDVEDVDLLTVHSAQASIFELTDALADGNQQAAQRLLHRLLEEEDTQAVFSMVVRQYRLLVQAREVLDEGGDFKTIHREVVGSPGMNEFMAKKLATQANHWKLPALINLYHQLLEIDEAAKTSQMPLEIALDLLVAESRTK